MSATAIRAATVSPITDPVGDTSGGREIGFIKEDHPNASAILFDNLDRNPEAVAVTGPAGTLTYAELCASACRWGNAFIAAGLQRGDRIPFFLDDTPVFVAAFFGAARAGFVPVLLNTLTTPDLLNFFLADTDARIALCESDLVDKFSDEALVGIALDYIVVANGEGATPDERFVHASEFVSGQSDTLTVADTGPDDMCFWMYSSGSTGRPKGIVHLQHDMAYTVQSFARHFLDVAPGDICFSVPKLFFAYGFGNGITFPFAAGATSLLMPGRPEPDRILATIEDFRPTIFFGLPTLYTALCRADQVDHRDLGSIRLSVSAAETLSEDIFNAWKNLTGLDVMEGLGSTEVLHIYLSNLPDEKRIGSAGKRVPGYEILLKDKDDREVAPGEEGVMWVRGQSTAPCYWNRPDKTAETMRGDWLYTGDRFIEKDGFYFFQGRADDLIKVSGQWVWPLEVERCLAEHPHIHECAVLAHQMDDRRMTLKAFVRLRDGFTPDAATTKLLQDHVKQRLLPYKYPRIVTYLPELPKTGTGKLDRQALAKL
ncbi:benzoate-CoA ligase family protein [Rhizobium sp. EC-SD404]|uniref:benzoate-CoA ligase family protein n=1 Tax=Rhizobium sp. EC-SD404 TaxID=2038389 RepID=UPI00125473C1|nr:benzoate-CoA ligase family protein [Rhizobium sp. EC-SD404]VVT08406.1 Benzoate--CoA ligase [Rhizobium sp. EC-SD404]